MKISRPRVDRKIKSAVDELKPTDMPPMWTFTIDCPNFGLIYFDFQEMRNYQRDEIAGSIRDAFWSMRHVSEGASLQSYLNSIRKFWNFLDDFRLSGEAITRLDQIDRRCIDAYLTWLELQTVASNQKNTGKKLSTGMKRTAYSAIKTILFNRKRFDPDAVSPFLTFPKNPFPNANQLSLKRQPYSNQEHRRILQALNNDLKHINESNVHSLPSLQILVVYLLVLASATGENLQPLLELRRDSLRDHPLKDRELLFTQKRRGWTTFATSVRKSQITPETVNGTHAIPTSVGDHFRALCAFTSPISMKIEERHSSFVFLWSVSRGKRKDKLIRLTRLEAKTGIRDFSKRHSLLDDQGKPLALSFGRFRPTFATELYRRTHDIRKVSQALGHASVETTARSYVNLTSDATRNHSFVAEGMVAKFVRLESHGKTVLAADGSIPITEIKGLLTSGYSTGVAHCRNPFREEESVCKKFFTCFRCPNMLVFEDDLWRLFSFYFRLLSERSKLRPDHWLKTYAPILRRIDDEIAPQFPSEKVLEARNKAQTNPHPAWKGFT
ncbi:site-specific tyrosine recombinase XerS [Janthinobacterium sp. HH104]|uniref:tyrosine-type recombinase/integrase n=1 Tax=Janthinobacterium sp. HH104 TaxID=1537276 RepID=UPI0008930E34|nr:tyrosine-type recombinase/integrase [Janthinobacterium sp. HH104]OEZ85317.1 site-specific tyrosine recombinase XerS [Janthinobacterium sp. HH104]